MHLQYEMSVETTAQNVLIPAQGGLSVDTTSGPTKLQN